MMDEMDDTLRDLGLRFPDNWSGGEYRIGRSDWINSGGQELEDLLKYRYVRLIRRLTSIFNANFSQSLRDILFIPGPAGAATGRRTRSKRCRTNFMCAHTTLIPNDPRHSENYREVGKIKAIIVVTKDKDKPPSNNSVHVDMRLLRAPQSYAVRLYVINALNLQPKDLNGMYERGCGCVLRMQVSFYSRCLSDTHP
jgi:hypothetical protein